MKTDEVSTANKAVTTTKLRSCEKLDRRIESSRSMSMCPCIIPSREHNPNRTHLSPIRPQLILNNIKMHKIPTSLECYGDSTNSQDAIRNTKCKK